MKAEYTKGPWNYDENVGSDYYPVYSNGKLVAEIETSQSKIGLNRSLTESEKTEFSANARLIAASPELIEALQKAQTVLNWYMLNSFDWDIDDSEALQSCEAAIRKATEQ